MLDVPADGAPIRIVLADDHTLFREGIAQMLGMENDLEVVGEANTGTELLTIVRRARPDAVMLDIEMPGPGPEAAIRVIRREFPNTQVIVLTMHDDPGLVDKMLSAGAAAFVSKGTNREALLAAIRGTTRAEQNVVIAVSRDTMLHLRNPASSILSPREAEVLAAVSAGLGNAQIARRLFITEGTVKRHLTNIYGKLGVNTRMNAINKAIAMGIIEPKSFKRHHP